MAKLIPEFEAIDLLFKNFFNDEFFGPLNGRKVGHPVDIYETESGLNIEVAATGLSTSDVEISIEGDVLRISHEKEEDKKTYIHRGITKKSFNLGYRVSSKYDLSQAKATMLNGLLTISIPCAPKEQPTKRILSIENPPKLVIR